MLYVVATPIGNLEDITQRSRSVLSAVDIVAAEDTRRTGKLFEMLGIDNDLIAFHAHNEATVSNQLLERLHRGESVAIVSDAGTPLIADPGFELVREALATGIKVEPVPGSSALVAAISVSGIPANKFVFEGFVPSRSSARDEFYHALREEARTIVVYEVPHRVEASVAAIANCFGESRRITICRELTKTYEQIVSGSAIDLLSKLKEGQIQQKGEFVLVIAGNDAAANTDDDKLLKALLTELSPSKSAAVAAKLSSRSRKELYERALELKPHK